MYHAAVIFHIIKSLATGFTRFRLVLSYYTVLWALFIILVKVKARNLGWLYLPHIRVIGKARQTQH
jgi:hypothetical protein